jgi:hypothetical protein
MTHPPEEAPTVSSLPLVDAISAAALRHMRRASSLVTALAKNLSPRTAVSPHSCVGTPVGTASRPPRAPRTRPIRRATRARRTKRPTAPGKTRASTTRRRNRAYPRASAPGGGFTRPRSPPRSLRAAATRRRVTSVRSLHSASVGSVHPSLFDSHVFVRCRLNAATAASVGLDPSTNASAFSAVTARVSSTRFSMSSPSCFFPCSCPGGDVSPPPDPPPPLSAPSVPPGDARLDAGSLALSGLSLLTPCAQPSRLGTGGGDACPGGPSSRASW